MQLLDKIPWVILIPAAVFLGLAPFVPQPHLVEKISMLRQGALHRPVDIFDLFYHGLPIVLIAAKTVRIFLMR